ncbi:polysaccharide deacetylase family protein [Egicoccus sp. AB-alg2]|uniref:polysaccharide deacetylase family protein n=1 Tax=Egicoccus sp. AB-alg2 TaxID=3242693 RepID=UPI00359DE124
MRAQRGGKRSWLSRAGGVALAALLVGPVAAGAPPAAAATPDQPVLVRDRTWSVRGGPSFAFGRTGDVQVMGDWNGDGTATPGVFRDGRWHLRNRLATGATELSFTFGRAGDVPVVGDWDGDGRDGVGVVRRARWLLRDPLSAGPASHDFTYGRIGDVPVTGDWNGNGRTGIGVVRNNRWLLRNARSAGAPNHDFRFGNVGDVPVTGDWNGTGRSGVGVVRGRSWYLRNPLSAGAASQSFAFGACGDAPLSTGSARTEPGVPTSMRGTEWTRLPTSERVVALTFDAGANADALPSILRTLRNTGTPATFFLTGDWVTEFPAQARAIAAAGHPIGNHTVSHPDLTTRSDTEVRSQVVRADRTIRAATGVDPRPWFRFPFGARDARTIGIVNCTNYGSVRWTVDTLGWQGTSGGQSKATVTRRVLDTLQPGQIVLMHVGSHPRDRSMLDAAALPDVIARIEARGYRFVDLDDYR